MRDTKIVFLLFPQTHLLDLSGPAQVFYEASQLGGHRFQVLFASLGGAVCSEQGLVLSGAVEPEQVCLEKFDMVCVPGFDFQKFKNGGLDADIQRLKPWFWQQRRKGVYISSICSGALALAQMGLLDNMQCTTHWKCLDYTRNRFPGAKWQDDRLYVFDKGIFTSAGMTAGIDMSLSLVEKWYNPLLAAKVAQEMVINVRRAETKDQKNTFLNFENHFNEAVYRVQEILANNLDVGFTLSDLAKKMNVSERQLSRIFLRQTGKTILAYRNELRLELGEQLLRNTEMRIKEIANACGYESSRQFIRLWNSYKQASPSTFRKISGTR